MEHGPGRFNNSMREWGRRNLSFNSDWARRFRSRSRSPTPKVKPPRPRTPDNHHGAGAGPLHAPEIAGMALTFLRTETKLAFPSRPPWTTEPLKPSRRLNTTASERRPAVRAHAHSRSRTPSLHGNLHPRPTTPTRAGAHPPLVRANSQGGGGAPGPGGPVPRSMKRWARSAHLHEIRGGAGPRAQADSGREGGSEQGSRSLESENEFLDIFGTPSASRRNGSRVVRGMVNVSDLVFGDLDGEDRGPVLDETLGLYRSPLLAKSEESGGDGDAWVDTDASVDGSEVELELDP